MVLIKLNNQEIELKYTLNAICEIEEMTGKGLLSLIKEENLGFNFIRLFVWAGIRDKMPNIPKETVGTWLQELIEEEGTFENIFVKVTKALEKSGLLGNKQDIKKKI